MSRFLRPAVISMKAYAPGEQIKDAIKLAGESMEGSFFKATLIKDGDKKIFDKEFFIQQHGEVAYDAYTKNIKFDTVRVTSR